MNILLKKARKNTTNGELKLRGYTANEMKSSK